MTKSKIVKPEPSMTTLQTQINLHPKIAAYALWLSLHTGRYTPGNLDGVVTQLITEAVIERTSGDEQWTRSFHRWVGARLRGRPMNKEQRGMLRRAMVQRITALRARVKEQQQAA
jgi:hypothetical protein